MPEIEEIKVKNPAFEIVENEWVWGCNGVATQLLFYRVKLKVRNVFLEHHLALTALRIEADRRFPEISKYFKELDLSIGGHIVHQKKYISQMDEDDFDFDALSHSFIDHFIDLEEDIKANRKPPRFR